MGKRIYWGSVEARALGQVFIDMLPRRIRYFTIGPLTLCWYARHERMNRSTE